MHGIGTNGFLWRNVIRELAGERRCVALDLPGHGSTAAPPDGDLSVGALAAVVTAFVEALDAGPVDLVANDTGGALAQIVAARRPELVRTLTLTNCDTHDNLPPPEFQPTVDLARAGQLVPAGAALIADLGAARTAVFGTGYEDPEQPSLDVVASYLEPVIGTPERAEVFQQIIAGLEPHDLLEVEPQLREMQVPTLVAWGTGDPFFALDWAYWLRDTIPGVTEVVEIDGARLFFPDERAADLVPHLRRHWAAAAV